jgi:hypothetical protein
MTTIKDLFEANKNKSKEEKREIYKSLISSEDKLEIYRLEKNSFFVPENAQLDQTKEYFSHSAMYVLTVTPYTTGPQSWKYSLGKVFKIVEEGKLELISEVQRNYGSFPFVFIEGHANGHDYLVCGEDYQGQTVIELDTGKKVSRVPQMGGFCWVNMMPSPSGNLMAVDGCYWACPYEIKIYDFSNPMDLPFNCLTEEYCIEKFEGWNKDESCNISVEYDTRKSDGKPLKDLTEEEETELERLCTPGTNQNEIYGYERKNLVWKTPA